MARSRLSPIINIDDPDGRHPINPSSKRNFRLHDFLIATAYLNGPARNAIVYYGSATVTTPVAAGRGTEFRGTFLDYAYCACAGRAGRPARATGLRSIPRRATTAHLRATTKWSCEVLVWWRGRVRVRPVINDSCSAAAKQMIIIGNIVVVVPVLVALESYLLLRA